MKLYLALALVCVFFNLSGGLVYEKPSEKQMHLGDSTRAQRIKRQLGWTDGLSAAWYGIKSFHPRGYGSWHSVFGG
uniref:Uncharacterized protein n=1 Tax=Acrobeloides nanus TaxID=290746 RepID=A0A914CJB0_9BILA